MGYSFIDLLIIFSVVCGPAKAIAIFANEGVHMTREERRKTVITAVIASSAILFTFAILGQQIISVFHVSVPALEIAGGIILFVFAINLVLGESHDHDPAVEDAPKKSIAFYPLAMPLLATPQAIVALVVVNARLPDLAAKAVGLAALGTQMVINLVILLFIGMAMKPGGEGQKTGGGVTEIIMRIVAILFCGFAVELVLLGLRDLGIVPPIELPHG
ncbi:MAG: MarC family protein [Pseudomonadota bacterium]